MQALRPRHGGRPCALTPVDLRPFFHAAIDLFGLERVLFGSDWPVCTLAASYDAVLDALLDAIGELSARERDAVLGGNARRVYALPATRAATDGSARDGDADA